MEDYDIRATIPTLNVDFLSLTVLRLYGIPITCVPPNSVQELKLNFPALRKYKTVNCTWINVKRITIEMPKLEVLIIEDTNVLMSDGSLCVINLCASNLVEFSYSGQMSDTTSVALTIKSVASANIYPRYCLNGAQNAHFAYQFLSTFNDKVEHLRFEHPQVLAPAVNSMVGLPEFEMLTDLELDKIRGSLLWFLLLKAPFIETLTLKELLSFEHPSTPNLVPPCVSSKLEVVNFGRFQGKEHELRFAKLVFENAQVLKWVNFTCPPASYGKELKEKILAFERSASAVIEFLCIYSY
ncbi:unnamed protein product [Sphenostylis stenocarpa]|uniref:FBD domain-containing protein n=1 Tax=Sphenostylis stenocarpa TaxID=92480 RepID=A0AA86SNL9_9FABA|nr:unnamed protein product [Sphenostylis stenocarpa]